MEWNEFWRRECCEMSRLQILFLWYTEKGVLKQGEEWGVTESRKGWRTRDKERQMSPGNSSSSTDVNGESLLKKKAWFLQVEGVSLLLFRYWAVPNTSLKAAWMFFTFQHASSVKFNANAAVITKKDRNVFFFIVQWEFITADSSFLLLSHKITRWLLPEVYQSPLPPL